ncbi:hypothetical protein PYCC9005_004330 [Savitreella phatthalungensis]
MHAGARDGRISKIRGLSLIKTSDDAGARELLNDLSLALLSPGLGRKQVTDPEMQEEIRVSRDVQKEQENLIQARVNGRASSAAVVAHTQRYAHTHAHPHRHQHHHLALAEGVDAQSPTSRRRLRIATGVSRAISSQSPHDRTRSGCSWHGHQSDRFREGLRSAPLAGFTFGRPPAGEAGHRNCIGGRNAALAPIATKVERDEDHLSSSSTSGAASSMAGRGRDLPRLGDLQLPTPATHHQRPMILPLRGPETPNAAGAAVTRRSRDEAADMEIDTSHLLTPRVGRDGVELRVEGSTTVTPVRGSMTVEEMNADRMNASLDRIARNTEIVMASDIDQQTPTRVTSQAQYPSPASSSDAELTSPRSGSMPVYTSSAVVPMPHAGEDRLSVLSRAARLRDQREQYLRRCAESFDAFHGL